MANVYQQQAKQRKVIYLVAIVCLLGLSLLVRGTFFRLDKKPVEEVREGGFVSLTMDGRAKVHELTELQQGDTELGGAAVQLLLTGSRGLAICALWNNAIEKQRKQEWNELDISVDSITKLQPHFTAPWLFQSWNLAYNVSVEMDRLNDMYFYIARGVSIIAKGESLNRNNPDLRWNIGFYYQNKFGVSDRVTTLRCLYQLSCLPEEDRDPERLRNSDGTVNLEAFEKFCQANPQFVRRLKEVRVPVDGNEKSARPLAPSPDAVVAFLKTNWKIPSRYKRGTKDLNDRLAQFPVLADLTGQPVTTTELDYKSPLADHESDAFIVARGWYSLANCSLPPPDGKPSGNNSYNPDPLKYRIPKRPSTIIFRQAPPRSQTYVAERLTKEGWFDREPWAIDDPAADVQFWLPRKDGQVARFSTPVSAIDAWTEASRRWRDHGRANGLFLSPETVSGYLALAERYVKRHPGYNVGMFPPPLTPDEVDDPVAKAEHEGLALINAWTANRSMTNFESFDIEADAMKEERAIQARKLFFRAGRYHAQGLYEQADETYREGFAAWKQILASKNECRIRRAENRDVALPGAGCRDFRDVEKYQEEMYELNLDYVRLLHTRLKTSLEQSTPWILDILAHAGDAMAPLRVVGDLSVLGAEVELPRKKEDPITVEPRLPIVRDLPALRLAGPLDGTSEDGTPWIPEEIKTRVRMKLGLVKQAGEPAPTAPKSGDDRALPGQPSN
ncbi:MAG TPA: hypothetical protein VM597_10455 [Gemmataceae bacterium]|jgi:hypothetical protein|nr:hypothetical protein [Gemmataceae bacterium]